MKPDYGKRVPVDTRAFYLHHFPVSLTRDIITNRAGRLLIYESSGPLWFRPFSPMTRTGHVTLVLGGARSGKSGFSERLAKESGLERHYIATGQAYDDEMRQRIALHRADRGDGWTTHEKPLDLVEQLGAIDEPGRVVLVDCLTLWITNLMMDGRDVDAAGAALVRQFENLSGRLLLVSNEVGLGIVPDNRMAREFRDHAGRLHQRIAAVADEVFFIAAGLPLKMKG